MNYTSEQGNVILDDSVFARIVTECGARFFRRMIFSTPKGKPMRVGRTGKEALGFVGVEYVEAMNAVNYKIYEII